MGISRQSWRRAAVGVMAVWGVLAGDAGAWNAHGHRIVARLAVDTLPQDMPSYLREAGVAERIVEQAVEPDRWRGTKRPSIQHEDNQDHYLDVEDLKRYGLTLQTLPRYRYDFVRAMALAEARTPEAFAEYDAAADTDHTKRYCGFLPYGIMASFARLQATFQTIRVLEAINDPARASQLEQAKQNAIYHMGILAHFVGDTAQPLHTTQHHHGWVGENPNGYTTDHGIHAYIDGTILDIHALTYESLRSQLGTPEAIDTKDPWPQTIAYLQRSFEHVEPLYKLQKSGELTGEAGKAFISERLCDGGRMLGAFYAAAWKASAPSQGDITNYIKYNEMRAKRGGNESGVPREETPKTPEGEAPK